MRRELAFLIISLICFALIPLFIWSNFSSRQAFDDTLGTILTISLSICFGLASLLMFIRLRGEGNFNREAGTAARILCGIGLILWGCSIFTEKNRFAARPVMETQAIVTWEYDRRGSVEFNYKYRDNSGRWYNGSDDMDGWFPVYNDIVFSFYRGHKIPVNYLQANPSVSRLTPNQHLIQVYFLKTVLILLGIALLTGTRKKTFSAGLGSFRFSIKSKDEE